MRPGGYGLAAVRAPDRIGYRKLAAACGMKRTDIFRLTREEIVQTFDVEAGSVSPILLRDDVRILFGATVPTRETVFCWIGCSRRTDSGCYAGRLGRLFLRL